MLPAGNCALAAAKVKGEQIAKGLLDKGILPPFLPLHEVPALAAEQRL